MTGTRSRETMAIHAVLERFTDALRKKDAAAAAALYTDDIVVYDLPPPLAIGAAEAHDPARLDEWFDTWDGPIESKADRLTIRVGRDVAYAFALRRLTGKKKGGEEVDLWFRATACFVKLDGEWKIAHMHNSVPFAMDGSQRALLDLEPGRDADRVRTR